MCGRFSLAKTKLELEKRYKASFPAEEETKWQPSFNIAPSFYLPVITDEDPGSFRFYKWGLVPSWAKDEKIGNKLANARSETLFEKPSFRNAIKKRRCLVPSDGYFEWKKEGKGKTPFRICRKDEDVFSLAGVWESWKQPGGKPLFSFTIITQPASKNISDIHDRMPAILLPEDEKLWLEPELAEKDIMKLIYPYPEELVKYYPVSNRINKVSENDKSLLDPVASNSGQGSLF